MPTTPSTPAVKPARKTPAQIAQQRLDVANRRLMDLMDKIHANAMEKEALDAQLVEARADRDYKAANPALTKASGATVEELKAKLATDPVTA